LDSPVRRSFAIALVLGTALVACARAPLPVRLAGLHRTRVWTGQRATRLIAGMHGKDVAPRVSIVADYGARGELRVFLSVYASGSQAARALARMLDGMRSGNTPFTPPRPDGTSGRWLTFGLGSHHLLWVSEGRVYWLQGHPEAVQNAAAELPSPSPGVWT
jgi:hypothetical protein